MGLWGRPKNLKDGELLIPAGQNSITILLDFEPIEVSAALVDLETSPGYPACQPLAGDTATAAIVHYAAGQQDEVWGVTISWKVAGARQISWMAKDYAG
jgi:hypothetical protein